jgi:signal transduction histidine kinase
VDGTSEDLDLLARVCHDLRQPAQAVVAYAEMLGRFPHDPERTQEWADHLRKAGTAIEELAAALLAVSASGAEDDTPGVDVATVVDEVLSLTQPAANRAGVHLAATVPHGFVVAAGAGVLRRCLTNVVSNAIRHSPGGRVTIDLSLDADDADRVRVCVRDSGPGMDRDALAHIGRPLARRGRTNGTALGLAIVSELLADAGGSLHVDSAPGRGTTCALDLPLTEVPMTLSA